MESEKDYIIEKVSWFTKRKFTPPLTLEEINQSYLTFRIMIDFLQSHNLTTRVILLENELVTDDSELKVSDLTEKGLLFYKKGIILWNKRIDRNKDKLRAIQDISFLEKKFRDLKEGD